METDDVNDLFIDSGASTHMSCNKDWFDEYHETIDETYVYLRDKKSLKVQDYGVKGVNLLDGKMRQIHNVMYVPTSKNNLIIYVSIGHKMSLRGGGGQIYGFQNFDHFIPNVNIG